VPCIGNVTKCDFFTDIESACRSGSVAPTGIRWDCVHSTRQRQTDASVGVCRRVRHSHLARLGDDAGSARWRDTTDPWGSDSIGRAGHCRHDAHRNDLLNESRRAFHQYYGTQLGKFRFLSDGQHLPGAERSRSMVFGCVGVRSPERQSRS
jgi:hypothetical protein